MSADPIDRQVFLARSGKPHEATISHLEATHSLPATAGYLFNTITRGDHDPDAARMLEAIAAQRDSDPDSPTYGCLKWYLEHPGIGDTNASFFTCLPLAVLYLAFGERLSEAEQQGVREVFAVSAPWFRRMANSPSLFYPNKCLGDVAMLLATGHILGDETIIAEARDFCRRYLDYIETRGTGWGEDHSPVYIRVIIEMGLLIMLLEQSSELARRSREMIDALMEWVVFNDGLDAVPSIRGYNFEAKQEVPWEVKFLIEGQPAPEALTALSVLATATAYRYQPQPLTVPRQWRRRTFDHHTSTSYIGPHSRLGTLSHYPLMPNTIHHDTWGLAWQTKPASFIVPGHDYGILQWRSEDDEGEVRRHEARVGADYSSRHLFKRLSFHPDVITVAHQQGPAAIILREIHNLHSPTVKLDDRWRLVPGAARVLIGGEEWSGETTSVPPDWIVLDYGHTAVAIRPLKCRVLDPPDDDPNPQRRMEGNIVALPVRLQRNDNELHLSLPLIDAAADTVTQPLLFSGWCVVLIDSPADIQNLSLTESFHEDGEIPRTYGELIRTVELTTPQGSLKLVRDMLTDQELRYTNGVSDNV